MRPTVLDLDFLGGPTATKNGCHASSTWRLDVQGGRIDGRERVRHHVQQIQALPGPRTAGRHRDAGRRAREFASRAELLAARISRHVAPYRVEERIGRSSIPRLKGAEVFVQAKPGLTAEWLQLTLARHVAALRGPASMPDCAFDVNGVAVRVDSAGTGFLVKIIARDTVKGEEVLRRARLVLS